MIIKFNSYNEKALKPLSDDILKIDDEKGNFEKVKEVEIVQITGILSEEEALKMDDSLIVHAGNFSDHNIKRGDVIWLSCLMKKPGVSYTAQTQGVIKVRVTDIFLGMSKLNSLM